MNCRICGNPLFAGRATFRCSCGAITHAYCWEKHLLQTHEPSFEVGTVDLDGLFVIPPPAEEDETAPAMIAAGEAAAE